MRVRDRVKFVKFAVLALWPGAAQAHVSEQGFVLLLPTGVYTFAGVAVVVLTILALFALPPAWVQRVFEWRSIRERSVGKAQVVTSLLSLGVLLFLLWIGLFGSRSPLSNLLPLMFWTVGWVGLVSLTGVFGHIWAWINPWSGLYRLIGGRKPPLSLPQVLGMWPAIVLFLGFCAFLLADPAPDDPARLARLLALYWAATFAAMLMFGPDWLRHGEIGHAISASYGALTIRRGSDGAGIGGPGWQIVHRAMSAGAGVFALVLLGAGSFDGLNETFWWLARLGVNPLEFPGRSGLIGQTVLGLAGAIAALMIAFSATIWLGLQIAKQDVAFSHAFGVLALSLLPIALVYHVAHYLTSFLVNIQYVIAALSDPFTRGADWLGIQPFRVTTGFFNTISTVRLIWLTQAGLVVLGHVWSVLLAHRLALDLFGTHRRAALATLPLSLFMVGYTYLGLWLLAAPRGA